MSINHSVFVLDVQGNPISPTMPSKARKLLKAGVAKKIWSKFNTFGIQMLVDTRKETPITSLGIDNGTKFEGYSVVVGIENSLSVKLDLPDKDNITKKMEERKICRRSRRHRKCRRRPARFQNRSRKEFIAPSQLVIVQSRLKIMRALFAIYPITLVGFEDVRFNHAKYRWGKNFSTVELGKSCLKRFFASKRVDVTYFKGYETKELRSLYGYIKTKAKHANVFTAHCTDSLALACAVTLKIRVEPGRFLVVDDTYRPVRRKLHYTQPGKDGKRDKYSRGTVFNIAKGRLIGTNKGRVGQLCGEYKSEYRYYDEFGKRKSTVKIKWVSTQFKIRTKRILCK